ncbi:hypothetical protein KP509_34G018000 [Ceratopteris richardii]|uniref:Bifunctional inhibitor/plant lipid transfer protein/seed storage helical domain-containing protein n=1 Tax=Ceratopteris richardii TaxID=49495 RepID=A0A8T2QHL1_CERRI|nr:hypothetical protein KP509_34G018000 [Ceratopteris richardii]
MATWMLPLFLPLSLLQRDPFSETLMAACQAYVVGATPLPMWGPGASACCIALRGRPLSCLCSQTLPSYVQQLVNVKAVKNVLQTCDLQLPADNTCGGFKLGD